MTTNNNKDIEEIISEFDTLFPVIDDIATTSELLDAVEVVSAYPDKIKDWLRIALTTYADQRVREESKKTLQELLDEVAGGKEKELNARELIDEAEAFGRDVAIANDAYLKGKNVALDTITTIIKRKMEEI